MVGVRADVRARVLHHRAALAYEQRDLSLKTSYIAKVKTWTQMQGIGVMLLFPLLSDNRAALTWLLGSLTAAPLVVMAYFGSSRRSSGVARS